MKLADIERVLDTPKAEAVFLGLACITAFLYRGFEVLTTIAGGVPRLSHISYDGVYYAQIARNILAGDGLGWEAMLFPVLQPILTAFISFFTGISNLAFLSTLVSEIAGACLIIPVYLLARELYGKLPAAITVLIIIPYPHLAAISGADTAESLYTFLVALSLYLGYKSLSGGKSHYLFLTGASLGFTYLARPEGFFVFLAFFVVAAWRLMKLVARRDAFKGLGLLAAGFILLVLPYAAFLTSSYGRVVLSPKLAMESVLMKEKVLNQRLYADEVFGITPSGKLAWVEKGGAGLVLGYFTKDPARFVRAYMSNLGSELPWNVRNSSHLDGYPIVYPVYIWVLSLLGFVLLALREDTRWKAVLLWSPFFNMFVYPVFTSGFWIYHVPYVPILVILAVNGALFLTGLAGEKKALVTALAAVMVFVWMGLSVYTRFSSKPENVGAIKFRAQLSAESLKVGEWGRANLGTNVSYMMNWSRLVYYLGGRWVSLPADRPDRVVEYGTKQGADYIVEELMGGWEYRQSYFMNMSALEMVYIYEPMDKPYMVIIWRIKKGAGQASVG